MSNHEVTLKSPSDLGGQPTVSLVFMVKHRHASASDILAAMSAHVDEIVVVEVGGTSSLKKHPSLLTKPGTFIKVDEDSYPGLHVKDVPETYAMGSPLANEVCRWEHTGESLIADWGGVRNLGWTRCTQDWKVTLDGNEMFANPSYLVSVCHELEEFKAGLAFMPHLRRERSFLEWNVAKQWAGRLCRNDNIVSWKGVARETLEGSTKTALIEGSLTTYRVACEDQTSEGQEQFKALYANARKLDWDISPVDLLYMASTSKYVGMEDFGLSAIDVYLKTSLYTEERAWACALRGEIFEARGDYDEAAKWYKRSLAEHPGCKSAYRLCRALFMQSKWSECIAAFESGLGNDSFAHMIDDGLEVRERAYILVVGAYKQLGMVEAVKHGSKTLRELFPNNANVLRFCTEMEG